MRKKKLEIEYTFDFELLGITSSAKGYKLAWEVNAVLGARLTKQPDLTVIIKPNIMCSYAHYSHENEVNSLMLFRNKPNEPELRHDLVPEFPHYDYILLSKGEAHMDSKRLQELLRKISSIELVAFIPLAALKSKDNFIF